MGGLTLICFARASSAELDPATTHSAHEPEKCPTYSRKFCASLSTPAFSGILVREEQSHQSTCEIRAVRFLQCLYVSRRLADGYPRLLHLSSFVG
jgi:hypothetical protein